ncbi:uncharacterized protein K02A2.6-like isoform X1 [Aedes albopictus]|uniref:RNA-directed DNA polymerase n=1 Tax=Aedes albopictus TaxID=7160 RepID=A0ABM1ZGS8_AEDAL
MALYGTIDPYVPGTSFSNYIEHIEYFFSSNNVPDERKKDLFMTFAGMATFEELKLLYPSTDLKTLSYAEITKKLKERFDKVDNELVSRYKFRCRKQGPSESNENFILAVRLLAESCDFGQFRDTAIRDQLLFGLSDRKLQKRLLSEDELTLKTAERIIKSSEIAVNQADAINEDPNINSVKYRLGRRGEYSAQKIEYRGRERSRGRAYRGFYDRYDRSRSRSGPSAGQRSSNRGRYANFVCHFCKLRGHIQKHCYKYKDSQKGSVKFVGDVSKQDTARDDVHDYFKRLQDDYSSDSDSSGDYPCLMIRSVHKISEPCLLDVEIEGKIFKMEVDSGSAVTVICKADYLKFLSNNLLKKCKLVVVNGSTLEVLGIISVYVSVNFRKVKLELVVLINDRRFDPLIGRDWLDVFFENWRTSFSNALMIKNIPGPIESKTADLNRIKSKYASVFDRDLSTPIKGFEADLVLKEDSPIFRKAYDVPYRLKEKVLNHLDSLEKDGIITPIKTSLWASPVVVVIKKDGDIRLVIDCKVSINKVIIPNVYPLPTAQDVFASLAGCKVFCSLDLATAYTQLNLSYKSRKFVIINTPKGLYSYNRLPQGASSSAAILQQVMDTVLNGLEFVSCYLDDVLIAGKDYDDCKQKLLLVLDRLNRVNIKVNYKKCKFFVSVLPFLGHMISENGLQPNPDKVATIQQAEVPENVRLQRYIMELSIYDYEILYKPSERMGTADFCSRFPTKDEVPKGLEKHFIKSLNFSEELPLNHKLIADETNNDKFLQQVNSFLQHGWPKRLDKCFRDIFSQHQQLEKVDGCLLFEDRVVIPESLQRKILKILHANHAGIIKMKQEARKTVYWFGINTDIENYMKQCDTCLKITVVPDQNITSKMDSFV